MQACSRPLSNAQLFLGAEAGRTVVKVVWKRQRTGALEDAGAPFASTSYWRSFWSAGVPTRSNVLWS